MRIARITMGRQFPKEPHKVEILSDGKPDTVIYLDDLLVLIPSSVARMEDEVPIVELVKVRMHARQIREALEYFTNADAGIDRAKK